MYSSEDRRTDLLGVSRKIPGPRRIGCVPARGCGGLPEEAAVTLYAEPPQKQNADRNRKESVGRCCHRLQSGAALGQSVGVIGKGPFVFLEAREERDCLKSFNGRNGVGEEPRTPGRVGHQLLQEEDHWSHLGQSDGQN